jgi:hypothetical protein
MKQTPARLHLVRNGHAPRPEALAGDAIPPLEAWMAVSEWLERVSDAHLAVLLTEHQLLFTHVGTFASDLISEVIDRLDGRQAPHGPPTRGDAS